jgi:hypothetical protein
MRYTGSLGLAPVVHRLLLKAIGSTAYDLIWVDHGALLERKLVADLKRIAPKILVYNIDDPFGKRDGPEWRLFQGSLPEYDLTVVVREPNVREALNCGARRVMRVFMAADEVAHAPRSLSEEDRDAWASKVLFVGTGFPERGPFISDLIRRGVPLSVYGDRWDKLKQWPIIKPSWRGAGLETPDTYAAAMQSAEICLGLLSAGNRDLQTTRSCEIPSLGALLCAERTREHLALYKEGEEAVFWDNADECSRCCEVLLNEPELRKSIAALGRLRYLKNGWSNMKVAANILQIAMSESEELLKRHQAALPLNIDLGNAISRTSERM